MEIFEIKTPAKCAKVNDSKRKTQRIENGLFESFGKTPTKRTKKRVDETQRKTPAKRLQNWDIFVEPQRKIPAKLPKNWDIFDEPQWKMPAKKQKNIRITHVFSCINICRVPGMLFEHEADRPSV